MAQIRISKVRSVEPIDLARAPLTIGRSSSSDLVLASRSVSRHHCVIEKSDGKIHVRDLDSSHGTFVNGKRIGTAVLTDGDSIEIGRYTLIFAASNDPDVFDADGILLRGHAGSADSTGPGDDDHTTAEDPRVAQMHDDLVAMRRQLAAVQMEFDQHIEQAEAAAVSAESAGMAEKDELVSARAALAEREEALGALRQQLADARDDAAAHTEEIETLQGKIADLEDAATRPEASPGDAAADAATGEHVAAEDVEAAAAAADEAVSRLEAEHAAALEALETDLVSKQEQIEQIEEALSNQAAESASRDETARAEQQTLARSIAALEAERDELQSRWDAQEADRETHDVAVDAEQATLARGLEALETERDELRSQLEALEAERSNLAAQLITNESDRESLRQQVGSGEAELDDLQAGLDELIESSEREQQSMQRQIEHLESEQESLRQDHNRMQRGLEKKSHKLDGAEATVEALRQRVVDLEASLDDALHADEDRDRTLQRFLAVSRQLRNASDQLAAARRDLQTVEAMWVKTDEALDEAEQTGSIDAEQLARREAVGEKLEQTSQTYEELVRDLQDKVDNFTRLASAEDEVAQATRKATAAAARAGPHTGLLRTVAGVLRIRR